MGHPQQRPRSGHKGHRDPGADRLVLAAAAKYELELRAERQAEGIAAAQRRQAEGRMLPGKKHIGRPRVLGPPSWLRCVAWSTTASRSPRLPAP